jgi:hypothetical protein
MCYTIRWCFLQLTSLKFHHDITKYYSGAHLKVKEMGMESVPDEQTTSEYMSWQAGLFETVLMLNGCMLLVTKSHMIGRINGYLSEYASCCCFAHPETQTEWKFVGVLSTSAEGQTLTHK